jgi:hypothetical protein
MQFSAREGKHDDLVLALAIAVWRLTRQTSGDNWNEYYRRLSEKATPSSPSDRVRVQVPPELELTTIFGISGTAYIVGTGSDGRRMAMMSPDDAKALIYSPTASSSWREQNPNL